MSKVELIGLGVENFGGGVEGLLTVVSGLFFKSEDLSGGLNHLDGVGSLGLLIFNIGIESGHLSGHVFRGFSPHSNVGGVADLILSLGGSDGIAKVLKKSDNLLASRWVDGIHLNQGSECTDEWEEGRSLLHGSGADLHGHVLKLFNLKKIGGPS